MGIFDDDDLKIDDPLKPKKQDDGFKFDFSFDNYTKGLSDSLGATGGGDGTALPGSVPDAGKMSFRIDADVYSQPKLEPVPERPIAKPPAFEPIKPIRIEPVKPVVSLTGNQVPDPVRTDTDRRAENPSWIQKGVEALNSLNKPDYQDSGHIANLGINIGKALHFNPDETAGILSNTAQHDYDTSSDTGTLGIRVAWEAALDPAEMQRLAKAINQGYESRYAQNPGIADPGILLAEAMSRKSQQVTTTLNQYGDASYRHTSDRAKGMTDWQKAQFDPADLNPYSDYDLIQARNQVDTALSLGRDVTYDPEMAKRQAYEVFDRFNDSHGYDAKGNTGFGYANFSMDTLQEQVRDHMLNGSKLSYRNLE